MLAAGAAAALMVACGSTTSPSSAPSPLPHDVSSGAPEAPGTDAKQPGPGKKSGKTGAKPGKGKGSGAGAPGGSGPGPSGGEDAGGTSPAGGQGGPSGGGSGGGGGGGTHVAGSAGPSYPAAGTYVYSQRGYEEFCNATSCDRDPLPPRQRINAKYRSRSAESALVITTARASDDRLVRTSTRYTGAAAEVLEVHLEYSYQGFHFSRSYRPSPPVESLRFPLQPGDSWSGHWNGDVSGDYSVSVAGRESVGGAPAMRLQTHTTFRGDFKGKANATLWVRPRNGTVVRTAGNVSVDMGFGTYRSGFATTLASAP